jgi:hypothetical protein
MNRKSMTMSGFAITAISTVLGCNGQFPLGLIGGGSANRDVLPDSITLDISELGDEESNAAKMKDEEAARCTGDPAIDRTLRAGAVVTHAFHRLTDRALALGARIRSDIDDPTQTQVEGMFPVLGGTTAYKADFAAFDIDGDGTADGSGMANVEPVALRIWTDSGAGYQPFLCALVTTRPSTANLGAGEIFIMPSSAIPDAPADFFVHVVYDRTDSAHKWNEAFTTGHMRPNVNTSTAHHRVDVRTNANDQVERTIRSTTTFSEHPLGFADYAFAAHFQRGGTAVLLSGLSTGGTTQVDFSNVCVDISSCTIDAGGTACSEFDTQDMSFIDAAAASQLMFPADFPSTPTF